MKYDWKKFEPKIKEGKVFPLSTKGELALAEIVKTLPIMWHSTTPRKFQCQQGCFKCCTMCWFNNSEFLKLPKKYHSGLMEDQRHVIQTLKGKCVFYNEQSAFFCTIRKYRPLRCKIYPFHPILDTQRNSIVILTQDIMLWGGKANEEPASLCYGLGNGKDVSEEAGELCRDYLVHSILEQSYSRFLWMGKAEKFIDKKSLACRQRPKYKTFAQCHSARLNAVRQLGPQKFSSLMKAGLI